MPAPRTIPFDYPAPGPAVLPGAGLPWLDALRDDGRRLSAGGLPSTRMEAWKYTNLAPLAELDFQPPAPGAEVPEAGELPMSAEERAAELNAALGGWAYELPRYKSDQWFKKMDDLLKEE